MSTETFSKRFGHQPKQAEIKIRESAPPQLRNALLAIAEGELELGPHFLREVLCKVMRKLPDPENWSAYPNVWDECQYLIGQCSWPRVYEFAEVLHRRLVEEHQQESADQWENLVNEYFVETGVGWRLVAGLFESRGSEGRKRSGSSSSSRTGPKAVSASSSRTGSKSASESGSGVKLGASDLADSAGATKIFISYAREDKAIALRVHSDLRKKGYEPWIDKENLLPGERWKPAIDCAIRDSSIFIALMSSKSVSKRGYVQKEVLRALQALEEFPENAIFLIPARLDDCKPSHSTVEELNWVDLFPSYEAGFEKILSTLRVKC